MRAVLLSAGDDPAAWQDAFARAMPELELAIGADAPDPETVTAALVWKPSPGALARFPNLRVIQGLGHGVDYLFDDPELPRQVPIVRLVDPELVRQMSEYVCAAALWWHRCFDVYRTRQRAARWEQLQPRQTSERHVGVLGLGAIGADCALRLAGLGFTVHGWSRQPKQLDGIVCHHGSGGSTHALPPVIFWFACCRLHRRPVASSMRRRWQNCRTEAISLTSPAAAMWWSPICWRHWTAGSCPGLCWMSVPRNRHRLLSLLDSPEGSADAPRRRTHYARDRGTADCGQPAPAWLRSATAKPGRSSAALLNISGAISVLS